MRRRNLLWATCFVVTWSGFAAAQNAQPAAPAAGAQAPVRQPATSPAPSAPAPNAAPSATPSQRTPASNAMPQQTVSPNTPNAASDTRNRSRVATQANTVPPAARGVGTTNNKPDCSKLRGIEKSECERRDTVRDDLPAGVTSTQPPQPPR